MKPQSQLPKTSITWFNRRSTLFYGGLICGTVLGGLLSSGSGFLYLFFSQESVSVKNGKVNFNPETETIVSTTSKNPSVSGNDDSVATDESAATNGDDSPAIANPEDSFNSSNSPTIIGDNNTITLPNISELPGVDEKSYLSTTSLPSDQAKYSEVSDFQPDLLIPSASDGDKIKFENREITILNKPYKSFFNVSPFANGSRFVFRLNGTAKAALFQFGVADLPSKGNNRGKYIVRILADGQPLWAGECNRSEGNQGNQIVSVPLVNIEGKSSLTIEVTRTGGYGSYEENRLFFTQAQIYE